MKIEVSHRFRLEIIRLVKNILKLTRERHKSCNKKHHMLYMFDNLGVGKSIDEFRYNNGFDQSIIKSDKILAGY